MLTKGQRFWASISLFFVLIFFFGMSCSQPSSNQENNANEKITQNDGGPPKESSPQENTPDSSNKKELIIKRHWTYRMIAGVSMGSGMAAMLGMRHPEKFDVIGAMGGLADLRYMKHFIINMTISSGFCDLKKIEAAAKAGTLNTPAAYCVPPEPKPLFEFEFTAHYNNWHYDDAGGNWNRTHLITTMQDLLLALGNPSYQNPKSTYWPHPDIPNNRRSQPDRCKHPIRIKGFKNDRFNPEGKYDLITFCDGNRERNGIYRPNRPQEHTKPMEIVLAVDVNGNGKRDYGEPIISTPTERYEDVGVDGCPDEREDGKGGCVPKGQTGAGGKDPNGDRYHPTKNPTGTELNLQYDKGEPFKDYGLDGIPNTHDFGENDGKFTITDGYKNWLAHDPRENVLKMDKKTLDNLNIYLDGGIRDLFNFHIASARLLGAIKSRYKNKKRAQQFNRFISLTPGADSFDPNLVDWSDKGQHVFVRYGDPNATQAQIDAGDGDHVNGGGIVNRVLTFFSFASHQIPHANFDEEQTNYAAGEGKVKEIKYMSKLLGRMHKYYVILPPGYTINTKLRYPVMYFGHGYGMDGKGIATSLLLTIPQMAAGHIAKMILIAVHGQCTSHDRCTKGTFYLDGRGFNNDGVPMEKVFYEVVSEVEKRFKNRILPPEDLDYKVPIPSK